MASSFAAEFPITPTRTVHEVMKVACKWISGSPHTVFKSDALQGPPPTNGEKTLVAGPETITLAHSTTPDGEIGGIKYERSEESLAWTTSIVSLRSGDKHFLRMEVVCEALTTLVSLPPPKKPYFIKQALEELGGGSDGEIPVVSRPIPLSAGDEPIAASLILGTANNALPIVYVSAGVDDEHLVDPAELARFVAGLAHVIVEPSRSFSYRLKRLTKSRNAFGGTVGVYWPNSDRRNTYFPENRKQIGRALALQIAKDIRVALANRRQRSNCTWTNLRETLAKSSYEQLKAQGSTELAEYISAFDKDIELKQRGIDEREQEIARLASENRRLSHLADSATQGLIHLGEEHDLHNGEIRDIIIAALKDAEQRIAQPGSRRAHVIHDLLQANQPSGRADEIGNELKELLREYRSMDAKIRSAMTRLGFDLSDDGKHWKAVYQGDHRYTFSFPKTGGDHRGGLNMVRDIKSTLF